jgi:hypothetical protein
MVQLQGLVVPLQLIPPVAALQPPKTDPGLAVAVSVPLSVLPGESVQVALQFRFFAVLV